MEILVHGDPQKIWVGVCDCRHCGATIRYRCCDIQSTYIPTDMSGPSGKLPDEVIFWLSCPDCGNVVQLSRNKVE